MKRNLSFMAIERLETRQVLSATADVVLFVDESGSLVAPSQGVAPYDWFGDTVEALETKLVDRGIGVGTTFVEDDDPMENRYSVIQFGTGLNDWSFSGWKSTVADATQLFDTVPGQPKDFEDAVEPLFLAFDDDGGVDFDFRNNAAVHFVFFTDGGTGETGSVYGPEFDWKTNRGNPYGPATYGEILDVLAKSALLDESEGPNFVSDATMTVMAGAGYSESIFPTFGPRGDLAGDQILGVDLTVDDGWILHLDGDDPNGAVAFEASVYNFEDATAYGRVEVADDFTNNTDDLSYEDIRSEFLDLVDPTAGGVGDWLDQDGYKGEIYALLAWESGGTFWDIDALDVVNQYAYRELMVADMFDKIALQVADFDGDFEAIDSFEEWVDSNVAYMGDFGDIDQWIVKREEQIVGGPLSASDLAQYDLDGDGTLGDGDIMRLVEEVFRGLMGDVDRDGYVDQSDLNDVGSHWLQVNVFDWLLGDLNGDGIVNAIDLNFVGQDWLTNVWGI